MGFRIDPTSVVLFASGSVVLALVLCVVMRRHKRRGDRAIRWLMASNLALFAATLGVLLRPVIGFTAGSMTVLLGAYIGIVFAFFAVLSAEERPLPVRLVTVVGALAVAVHLVLIFDGQSVAALMVSSSVINSGLLIYIITRIWPIGQRLGQRMAILVCLPFAALCLAYLVRLGFVGIWGKGPAALLATLTIIVVMSWAAVILELAMITLREMQAQEKLKAALQRAEAANTARTKFLLTISHELRTPLNAILGLSEIMCQEVFGPVPHPYNQSVKHVKENGKVLNELISDLLMQTADTPGGDEEDAVVAIARAVHQKFASGEGASDPASSGMAASDPTGGPRKTATG